MHRAPSKRAPLVAALIAALVLVAGAVVAFRPAQTPLAAAPVDLAVPAGLSGDDLHAWCVARLAQGHLTSAARSWLNACAAASSPIPSPSGSPSPTPPGPTGSPTPSPTTTPAPTVTPTTTVGGTPTPAPTTPAPTPSPTPTGPVGWPTPGDTAAGTTGWRHTGVTLTLRTGLIHVTTPGTVIDSVEARDGIEVQADNVTIRRSLVEGANTGPGAGIWIDAGVNGTLIEDVEVTSRPGADPTVESAIVDRAVTAFATRGTVMRRVYAHRMIRGLQFGCDTVIEESYVDGEVNPGGAHMSAIGGETCTGTFALTVRHNHIGLAPNVSDSAALLYYPPQVGAYGDQIAAISIVDNEIAGGTYCMWLSSDPKLSGTLVVTGNRFRTTYYSTCGLYGRLFSDHLPSEGGMVITWSDNDGVVAPHG